MGENVKVGETTYKRSSFSTPIGYAFDACEELGEQSWSALAPKVRLGSFVRDLPPKAADAIKPTQALLDLGMAFEATALDAAPTLDCVYGVLPTEAVALDNALGALRGKSMSGTGAEAKTAKKFLAATAQFIGHLDPVRQAYWERCESVWFAVRGVEWIANDFYYAYLAHNRWMAQSERDRYLYPRNVGAHIPRTESDEFLGLKRGLAAINAARRSTHIDDVKREKTVVQGASLLIAAATLVNAVSEGRVILSPEDNRRLGYAAGLMTDAARNQAEAMQQYLGVVRLHGSRYPILSLLGPREVSADSTMYLARMIDDAIDDAVEAIEDLMMSGARRFAIPATHQDPHSMTPSALAKVIAHSGQTSVWKLPFFVERATQTLHDRDAADVDSVLALAEKVDSEGAIANALALGGIELAMMAAPAAGPIGVGVALQWGILQIIHAVREYRELKTLFAASIDPNYLLRGLEHEDASKLDVMLSFLGLIVV
jgi:hypothetical protein